jgi:invasion protein IalB
MIGSIGESYSLARLARVIPLAAVIFGFWVSSASTQQGQQVPTGAAKADVSGWVKICAKNEESANNQVCIVKYEELDPRTGSLLLSAAVRTVEGEPGQQLIINVSSAYSLVIPAGLQARIDEGEPVSMQFGVCLPTSCQAQMALSKEMLQKIISGKKLAVAAANAQKSMVFLVPLLGFQKSWTGVPTDAAKYQAARSQMLDFAKKTAEKQRAAQQPGAQLPAGGTAPQTLTPNASTTVPKGTPAPAVP